jgi:hypothetical protein
MNKQSFQSAGEIYSAFAMVKFADDLCEKEFHTKGLLLL